MKSNNKKGSYLVKDATFLNILDYFDKQVVYLINHLFIVSYIIILLYMYMLC